MLQKVSYSIFCALRFFWLFWIISGSLRRMLYLHLRKLSAWISAIFSIDWLWSGLMNDPKALQLVKRSLRRFSDLFRDRPWAIIALYSSLSNFASVRTKHLNAQSSHSCLWLICVAVSNFCILFRPLFRCLQSQEPTSCMSRLWMLMMGRLRWGWAP